MTTNTGNHSQRITALTAWAEQQLKLHIDIQPITGDASNRRYFRLLHQQQSWVVMDAPPELEDCRPFLDVTQRLRSAGLYAPEILGKDLQQGFLLLEDLGDDLYRDVNFQTPAKHPYQPIFNTLAVFAQSVNTDGLPDYDQLMLQQELDLLTDWYLPHHCNLPLSTDEQSTWRKICTALISCALQQPRVFVHRDFHSCNVLQTSINNPGIIDYQDAVRGPLSYDLISWILDRYISWPRTQVTDWYEQHRQRLDIDVAAAEWLRWCDWMGLQRNLKILGIFARLAYRDGKSDYINLMPRFYHYLMETADLYPETTAIVTILQQRPCVH